jgi:DNA-binding LacI/PurR family transcriptional regulator
VIHRPHCRPTVGLSVRRATEPRRVEAQPERGNAVSRISASNLVALIMWHGGGPLEHAVTSQQRIFSGMNQSLMKRGYHAVFLDLGERIGSEDENAAREAEQLRYIRDHGFGGAMFYPYAYRHNRELIEEVNRSVPLVLLDRKISGIDTDFVGIDNHGALADITRHLIAQGHRRIAHVTRFEPIHTVQERILGYTDTMRSKDSPDMEEMILNGPAYDDHRAWTVVDAVFGQPAGKRPTAAACSNDYMAVGLAKHLENLGLSVPTDVALTGFDNIIPALENGLGLTTVAQPYEEIGIAAVDLLMQRIEDRSSPTRSIELPAPLVIRASTA